MAEIMPVDLATQINNNTAAVLSAVTNDGIRFSSQITNQLILDAVEFPSDYLESKLAGMGHPKTTDVN